MEYMLTADFKLGCNNNSHAITICANVRNSLAGKKLFLRNSAFNPKFESKCSEMEMDDYAAWASMHDVGHSYNVYYGFDDP